MSKNDQNIIKDANLFGGESDAFAFINQLNADLEDALQSHSNITPVRGLALSSSSYTAGDTNDMAIRQLPETILSQLPSRISRRFSPLVQGEFNGVRPPDPFFYHNQNNQGQSDQVYPNAPFRSTRISELPSKQARENEVTVESLGVSDFDEVPASDFASALIQHLGIQQPGKKPSISSSLPAEEVALTSAVTVNPLYVNAAAFKGVAGDTELASDSAETLRVSNPTNPVEASSVKKKD